MGRGPPPSVRPPALNRQEHELISGLRFIDPHGLHHDGLAGTLDKFEALQKLAALSQAAEFTQEQITLDGFVLTDTKIEQIPDAAGRNWQQLQAEYPLLRQEGEYCKRLLEPR